MQDHSTRTPYFPPNLNDYAPWVATHGLLAPYGKCQCGCGESAPLMEETRKNRGWVRGKPHRYLKGHNRRAAVPGVMPPWVKIYGLQYPYGKCQCGCGEDAPIAKNTFVSRGSLRGEPQRFVSGHGNKGRRPHNRFETLADAFSKRITIGSPTECWDAISCGNHGYGVVHFQGNVYLAHRVAYTLFIGPIPNNMEVCHECDRTPCANPNHLFLGTHEDNMQDMVVKGRSANGHTRRKVERQVTEAGHVHK